MSHDIFGILAVTIWVLVSFVGASILWAPTSYNSFKLPSVAEQLKSIVRVRCLLLVGLATVAKAVYDCEDESINRYFSFQDERTSVTRSVYGDTTIWVGVLTITPILFAFLCLRMPTTSIQLIKGYAFFSIPLSWLRVYTLVSFADSDSLAGFLPTLISLTYVPDV